MEENYRNLCQVFTPTENVKQLLDWCGYTDNLYGKKIIENSCGDGSILKEVVKRYIEECFKNGISKSKIEMGLSNDIYAIEYDEPQYKRCIKNLDSIVKEYQLDKIKWKNIKNEDALLNLYEEKFDYVVARAVAQLNTLSEYSLPFLKINGKAILYKSDDIDEELKESIKGISLLGGKIEKIEEVYFEDFSRKIVFIDKINNTPKKYPRSGNKPRTNPL